MGNIFSDESEDEVVVKPSVPSSIAVGGAVAAPAASASSSAAQNSNTADSGVFSFLNRNNTFKPQKKVASKGTLRATMHATMKARLCCARTTHSVAVGLTDPNLPRQANMKATLGGMADMREAVRCPPNENLEEWLAVHTVHFFNAASMVYGTCCQYCDEQKCPAMTAGPKVEYLWMDGKVRTLFLNAEH